MNLRSDAEPSQDRTLDRASIQLSNPAPELLRPIQSDEFLPPISRWTSLGGLFIVGGCGIAVLLAATLKYTVTVKAPAIVRPSGELRVVQSATDGTVKQIEVRENQVVKAGDVFAYLDDSRLQTQKSQLQEKLRQAQTQLEQTENQIKAVNAQISAETHYLNRTVVSAQADLSRNQREYQDRQVVTATEVQEAEANLKLAKDTRDRYKAAAEAGALPQAQWVEKEQAVKVAEARLSRVQAALNPSSASVEIANQRIAQEQARGEAVLANLSKERDTLQQRRTELISQVNQTQKELQQTQIDLEKIVLRAPVSGTVLKLELRNSNQVLRSGDTIAQLAPDSGAMIVKSKVAAQDIGKVAIGQTAQLRISSYPYPDYGVLEGKVSTIAPDALPSANNTASAYEVTIELKQPYFVKHDRRYVLQPGMEGTVDIVSKEDTLLKFILRRARLLADL